MPSTPASNTTPHSDADQLFRAIHDADEHRVREIITTRPDLANAWLSGGNQWHGRAEFTGKSSSSRGEGPAPEGIDPLSYAAVRNHPDVLQVLLDAGANTEAVSFEGNMGWATPVQHAAFQSDDHAAVIKLLLDHGANPNAISSAGSTAIYTAAGHNRHAVIALLEEAGGIVDVHTAALLGRVDTVKQYLDAAAGWLDAEDGYLSATPLFSAAAGNQPEVVCLLSDYGANLHATGDIFGRSPAIIAASGLRTEALLALADVGADLNLTTSRDRGALASGSNVLHAAASQAFDAEVIASLIEAGADPTCRNSKGELPVDIARASDNDNLVNILAV